MINFGNFLVQQLLLQCKLDLLIKTLADRNQCQMIYFFLLLKKAVNKKTTSAIHYVGQGKKYWQLLVVGCNGCYCCCFPHASLNFWLNCMKKGTSFYLPVFYAAAEPVQSFMAHTKWLLLLLAAFSRKNGANQFDQLPFNFSILYFYSALYIFLGTR